MHLCSRKFTAPVTVLKRIDVFLVALPQPLAADMAGVERVVAGSLGAVASQGQVSVLCNLNLQ